MSEQRVNRFKGMYPWLDEQPDPLNCCSVFNLLPRELPYSLGYRVERLLSELEGTVMVAARTPDHTISLDEFKTITRNVDRARQNVIELIAMFSAPREVVEPVELTDF